ncbi:signal peptidase II [Patulibacter sp. NPDC049589]|uniref:signal peptidase II n=1 Tax=Patulibacter sp. NPDC049589 TaxID=3154731 RepID=UPI0034369263
MVALVALIVDVATKVVAESGAVLPIALPLGIDLELSHNPGIAFGSFTDLPPGVLYVGISLLVAVLAVAVLRGWPKESPTAGGLLLGGAVGNLGNRLLEGHVTDFVAVPHFSVFNLADVAITFGIVLLVLKSLREQPEVVDGEVSESVRQAAFASPAQPDRRPAWRRGGRRRRGEQHARRFR